MAYAAQANLEAMWGIKNIQKWADLDNDADITKITNRISLYLEDSEAYFNARFAEGRYAIPFTGNIPKIIRFLVCLKAGIDLHDARGIGSGKDPMMIKRTQLKRYEAQIASGQLKLADSLSGELLEETAASYPTLESDYVDPDCVCPEVVDPCNICDCD